MLSSGNGALRLPSADVSSLQQASPTSLSLSQPGRTPSATCYRSPDSSSDAAPRSNLRRPSYLQWPSLHRFASRRYVAMPHAAPQLQQRPSVQSISQPSPRPFVLGAPNSRLYLVDARVHCVQEGLQVTLDTAKFLQDTNMSNPLQYASDPLW